MTEHLRNERLLLLIVSLVALTGVFSINLAIESANYFSVAVIAMLCVCWFIVHAIVRGKGHKGDPLLFPLAALLVAVGLIMIFRLKPNLLIYQALWVFIGLAAFVFSAFFFRKIERLADYKYIFGVLGVCLLLTAIIFGVDIGGNRNWVILGPVRFQPSEFAKLFIVIFLAAYLNDRREVLALAGNRYGPITIPPLRFIAPLLAVWGLTMVMFILQRDLGSALLFFGIALLMTYMASGRLNYVIIGSFLFLLGSLVCYKLYSHVQVRVDIWLNPWGDPNGKAYQIIQSLFAFGAGGILGSGLTFGFPNLIPEVHTDFVFSAIGEEMGLVGSSAIIMIYIILIYRAFKAAISSGENFNALVAGGLAAATALQIFIIIGGVTKFLPLTGITLPFISYGGSSMVANFIFLGMLFAISEKRPNDAK
ncbi:FtsW/RodA/SpoVE family cell cycle protein [Dendrosporobacter sp. 1207_IL3150]|uniref:FtsW/RodA/SpoVE family cell cycle protein n=1 Tax=Dendrosporobacter sp. 1207_IL3150 TaxID=3084054 RepID=UPI002FDB439C